MRTAIPFNKLDIQLIDTADNGLDGYNKICKYLPDIIVCDISMPKLTGFEMLEKISEISNYHPQIVLLTGHDDFEYARKAITYKVLDYLTKPVMPSDLIDSLNRAKELCNTALFSKEQNKAYTENMLFRFIESLIKGNSFPAEEIALNEQKFNISLNAHSYTLIKLYIQDYSVVSNSYGNEKILLLKEKILEIFSIRFKRLYHTTFDSDTIFFLVLSDEMPNKNIEDKCNQLLSSLSVPVHIMISNTCPSLSELPLLMKQIKYCSTFSFCFRNSKLLIYSEIDRYIKESFQQDLYLQYEKNIKKQESHNLENWPQFISELENISNVFTYYDPVYIKNIVYSTILETISHLLHITSKDQKDAFSILWMDISTSESMDELIKICKNIATSFKPIVSFSLSGRHKKLSNEIKNYIYENYMKPISSSSLARMLYLSDRTIRDIFFKENGISLSDFLRQYRMEKAYELIKTGNYKIYEISQMVGYSDVSTFRKAFAQHFGKKPSDIITQ